MNQPLQFNESYWEDRYTKGQTGWDAGEITTPLKEYVDQLKDKSIRILIPGAGNAHEAAYLHEMGFTNVTVIDLAKQPLVNLKKRVPDFPDEHLIQGNFFDLNQKFDLIIEQTFFCALHPSERKAWAEKMEQLTSDGGKIAGVLFNKHFEGGPPFGGSKQEYLTYFEPLFDIKCMETCYNSIKPREGSELFIILQNKRNN
jgi:methyl halide transferase